MFYIILIDIRRHILIIWGIIPSLLPLLIIETSMFICGISIRSGSTSVCLLILIQFYAFHLIVLSSFLTYPLDVLVFFWQKKFYHFESIFQTCLLVFEVFVLQTQHLYLFFSTCCLGCCSVCFTNTISLFIFLNLSLGCCSVCFTNTTSVSNFLACCKDASVFYQDIWFHLLLTSRFCLV